VLAVVPVAEGRDTLVGVEDPWIAYSIPFRAAEVKFKVTKKK
jgi:hypothetical protein